MVHEETCFLDDDATLGFFFFLLVSPGHACLLLGVALLLALSCTALIAPSPIWWI